MEQSDLGLHCLPKDIGQNISGQCGVPGYKCQHASMSDKIPRPDLICLDFIIFVNTPGWPPDFKSSFRVTFLSEVVIEMHVMLVCYIIGAVLHRDRTPTCIQCHSAMITLICRLLIILSDSHFKIYILMIWMHSTRSGRVIRYGHRQKLGFESHKFNEKKTSFSFVKPINSLYKESCWNINELGYKHALYAA